jgi:transposase
VELYDDYTPKIRECDAQIERRFVGMKPRFESDARPPTLPPVKPGSKSPIQPAYNVRAHLMRLTGVDLVALTRISASIAQTILSEVGTDMSRFSTVKHFCSWLGLAPHNDISGGRVLRSRTLKVVNRATQAFRQAAQSVARSHSAFGAYFRSMRARLGPEQATVATAHKIARVVYHLLKHCDAFQGKSAIEYEWERREQELKHLSRRANTLGYTLIPRAASQPAPAP